jgi:hypothetical protein
VSAIPKLVLELLASSVDMSTTPVAEKHLRRYERSRSVSAACPDPERDRKRTGIIEPDGQTAATVHAPVKSTTPLRARLLEVHPLLQVRRRLW